MARFTLAVAILFCLAFLQPAQSQDDLSEPEAYDDDIEEIVVTGTRIVRRDYESSSPIVTVDSSLFEQSGSPSVGTMLNTLPQFTPWITESTNNRTGDNPTGQTIMDLRGLGFGRTLVLLDGKRIVPSNGYGSVDVNLIPPAIIQSVEVVSGGASAVYGSDAVAGVVNFRTRRFTGLEADASWAQTDMGDGLVWNAGLTGGLRFARGYAYGHLSIAERDPIMQGDRKFSEIARGYDERQEDFIALGSWAIRQGLFWEDYWNLPSQAAIDDYFMAVDPTYTAGALPPWVGMGYNPDGSLFSIEPVYNFTGDWDEPLQPVETSHYTYNYAPDNYLRLPMERTNFFGRAGLELGRDVELYAQLHWADYRSGKQLAPTPAYSMWIAPDNPHIHPALATMLASRPYPDELFWFGKRMTDLGPRKLDADYDARQIVVGASGGVGWTADWTFDVYGAFGQVDQSRTTDGGLSLTAFEELSLAPDAGASICGGEGMNPFGIDSISPECAAHIRRIGSEKTEIRQTVGEATISGPLFELPAGTVRAALGILYKQDRYENVGDETLNAQSLDPVYDYPRWDVQGMGGSDDMFGETSSREAFVEINLPLLADIPLARSLEATLGMRYGDHSNAGTIDAWKADTIWQISDPLTFRSSYQQAIRAPDFYALFTPQTETTFWWGNGEPCDSTYEPASEDSPIQGAQQDPDVAALCIAQGIPEEELPNYVATRRWAVGPSGGNPDLAEETAETITAGLVLRPSWDWAADLQASIDYYRIEVKDIVGYLGNPVIPCFNRARNPSLDPDNIYCQQFARNAQSFQIDEIRNIALNLAELSVTGYDLQVDVAFDAGPGRLRLHGLASYADSATQTAGPGSPQYEHAGKATGYSVTAETAFFSLVPRVRASAEAGYVLGPYDMNLTWRYVGDVQDNWITDFRLPSRQYWGLSFGFRPDTGFFEGLTIRGGVTNLTNTDAILYPSNVEANTEPSTYDVIGRRYFVRMTYRFM